MITSLMLKRKVI